MAITWDSPKSHEIPLQHYRNTYKQEPQVFTLSKKSQFSPSTGWVAGGVVVVVVGRGGGRGMGDDRPEILVLYFLRETSEQFSDISISKGAHEIVKIETIV